MSELFAKVRDFLTKGGDRTLEVGDEPQVLNGPPESLNGDRVGLPKSLVDRLEAATAAAARFGSEEVFLSEAIRDLDLMLQHDPRRLGECQEIADHGAPVFAGLADSGPEVRVVVEVHGRSVRTRVPQQNP